MNELSFSRYLLAKRSVDDRALNRQVWRALEDRLSALEGLPLLRVLELGAGVGTMFQRMVQWGLLTRAEYTLVDELPENIAAAREQVLPGWAKRQGLGLRGYENGLLLEGNGSEFLLETAAEEMTCFLERNQDRKWDLLVAHAFLDLLDVESALPRLRGAVERGGLMYLTINFDGLTAFEPALDRALDDKIISLYHQSMDERITAGKPSGDSRTGRHLFSGLARAGLRILEAGSSDWVVFPRQGAYPADEAYFLRFILHFFEDSLHARPELAPGELEAWLKARREQLERGELVYLAHQIDFLAEVE